MITHTNLADNLKLIVTGLSAVDDTVVVGWLPQVTDDVFHRSLSFAMDLSPIVYAFSC